MTEEEKFIKRYEDSLSKIKLLNEDISLSSLEYESSSFVIEKPKVKVRKIIVTKGPARPLSSNNLF